MFVFCLRFYREKPSGGVKGRISLRCSLHSSCLGSPRAKGHGPATQELGGICSENSEVRGQGWQNVAPGSGDITTLPNENVTKVRQTRISKLRSQVRMMVIGEAGRHLLNEVEGHNDTEQKDPAGKAQTLSCHWTEQEG